MGPLVGPMEVRLLALERRQARIDDELRAADRDLVELSQRSWDAWGDVRPPRVATPTPTPTPTPNSTIRGTVHGCNSSNVSGQTVTVSVTGTGTVLFTATTSGSGVYSGTCYLASNTGVTVSAAPTSVRYVASATTGTATAGGTTTINLTLAVASGYTCYFACSSPLPKTLTLASSGACGGITFPSDTLTFGPTPAWASSSFTGNIFVGATSFTVGTDTDWYYVLAGSGLWRARMGTGSAVLLGNPTISMSCGPPFSWPFSCGSSSFGGSIHE